MHRYLKEHTEVSDILMTVEIRNNGGCMEKGIAVVGAEYDHVQTIRVGTKALTYYPYRFLTELDADDLIELFT